VCIRATTGNYQTLEMGFIDSEGKRIVLRARLHETGNRVQVSETGTVRNRPPKNGNVQGNVGGNLVYKNKIK
jgi:hypothetical protein